MTFESKHKLDFYVAPWDHPLSSLLEDGERWYLYRVGTVKGQWRSTKTTYEILSFLNNEPGNGHLDDVFEWFEHSCKRDGMSLIVLQVVNTRFARHLVEKRGFVPYSQFSASFIKPFA